MTKIATIIGARPQFIKAATVSRVIASQQDVDEVMIHTGQHYDANMSEIFFEQLAIPEPDYNLAIGGGLHGAMTGKQLEKIEEVLIAEAPDWVLVYGDTNSTLAGALAAAKLHIPVAHVEAGLRSFNRQMPEEINRVLTDHVSTLLFTPTDTACRNLSAEGISGKGVQLVGDVMYDAALFYKERAVEPSWFAELAVDTGEYLLCTVHRAENTDSPQRLRGIFQGLADSRLPVILPLHPRTRSQIDELGLTIASNIHVVDPVGYLEIVWLQMNCRSVATDSGGMQKEAYFHRKPCVTLRDETEWVELVDGGYNVLCGADSEAIEKAVREATQPGEYRILYGDGSASNQVVERLVSAETKETPIGQAVGD